MASGDVWILGIHMTKFGKHPDKDTVDLAAEAAQAALKDGGVTMKDIGILAAGNLMSQGGAIGQALQKQIGQTGIPVYNVSNACATGATALRTTVMALKAGECEMGLAVGVEKLAGAGLLGAGGRAKSDKKEFTPQGRYGAVATVDGPCAVPSSLPESMSSTRTFVHVLPKSISSAAVIDGRPSSHRARRDRRPAPQAQPRRACPAGAACSWAGPAGRRFHP